jgi:hypothetical protein
MTPPRVSEEEEEEPLGVSEEEKEPLAGVVIADFKTKTECTPLCMPGSSFTHKATNSGINNITSIYYIVSYDKNLLQVQKGLSSGKATILPQADDRGFRTPRRSLHQSTPHLLSSIA